MVTGGDDNLSVNPPGSVHASARYIVADVFDGLASLPDNSVDLVVTSPPFLNLRSYLPPDHPEKAKEIGREPTPAEFIDSLLDVTEALERVLAPHGSIVVELGDTYSSGSPTKTNVAPSDAATQDGTPGTKRAKPKERSVEEAQADGFGGFLSFSKGGGEGWPLAKSLCGVPTIYTWSLAYGRNLLNPDRALDPWRVRNLMVWCKPSAPVQDLRDKFRAATSYITVATKSGSRYFDLFGVLNVDPDEAADQEVMFDVPAKFAGEGFVVGAPPKDYLVVRAKGFSGAHYATYPRELIETPVEAMCPVRVCTVCGEPSRRVVESVRLAKDGTVINTDYKDANTRAGTDDIYGNRRVGLPPDPYKHTVRRHVGWTDCGHGAWRAGVVLDPFGGSGTTLDVALHRPYPRSAIGIDIDERNATLAADRFDGMFDDFEVVRLEVTKPTDTADEPW